MSDLLAPIVFVCVSVLAVLIGRWVAIRRNRPGGEWLKRGRCPDCKSTKLLPTPLSPTSAVITCDDCESQWFVIGGDGQQITTSIGPRAYLPPLTLYWDELGRLVFETKLGYAKFDVTKFSAVDAPLFGPTKTPREILKSIADANIAPMRCDVSGHTRDPWKTFLDSAGIDLPFYLKDR